jgi:hypothetical protein
MYVRPDLNILVCLIAETRFVLAGKLPIIGRIDREVTKDKKSIVRPQAEIRRPRFKTLKAITEFLGHKALSAVFLIGAPLYIR